MGEIRAVALFGLFGVRNLGNEATLAVAMAGLRARLPGARLTLVSDAPSLEGALEPDFDVIAPDPLRLVAPTWLPWRLRRLCRAVAQLATEPWRARRASARLAGYDLLLIPGTGIADDFWQAPLDLPHQIARWCTAARRRGIAVRFASVGAGPVRSRWSRRWFARALRAADYRSYRDAASRTFATEVGVPAARDPVLPDLGFGLEIPPDCARPPAWPPRVIGLGVMGYKGWNVEGEAGERIYRDYLAKACTLAGGLLDRGYSVRLLIGNRGGDRRPVADLMAALGTRADGSRLVANKIDSYKDVLREIADCDLVVATRFHNVLKAGLMGRAVISIGYARKNDDLMAELGLGAYCHDVETFAPEDVLAQLDTLAALPAPPTAILALKVAEYRGRIQEQFDILSKT